MPFQIKRYTITLLEIILWGYLVSFKILIVEDHTDSRNLLNHCLLSKGFRVLTAMNGAEGLTIALSEKPALIISDIFMPIAGGVEMIK
jgi:CheY-like chemotaxis protein